MTSQTMDEECALYLSVSSISGAGRGIFAGRNLSHLNIIDLSPAIFVRYYHIYQTVLENYVFATTDDDYGMILLGVASLLNHDASKNAEYFGIGEYIDDIEGQVAGLTARSLCSINATQLIEMGTEIFIDYGEDWFIHRVLATPISPLALKMPRRKFCMSNIEIRDSTRYAANQGAFSVKSFSTGELITLSPVLLLLRAVVEDSKNSSLLMNYCYRWEESDVVFLPLGHASMINDYRSFYFNLSEVVEIDVGRSANVEVRWFNWEVFQQCDLPSDLDCLKDHRINHVPSVEELSYRSDGRTLSSLVFGYYALQSIKEQEELLLDYGFYWDIAYRDYLRIVENENISVTTFPLFRHFIDVAPKAKAINFAMDGSV